MKNKSYHKTVKTKQKGKTVMQGGKNNLESTNEGLKQGQYGAKRRSGRSL